MSARCLVAVLAILQPWTGEYPITWREGCCVVAELMGALGMQAVVLMELDIKLQLFHRAHENDVVEEYVSGVHFCPKSETVDEKSCLISATNCSEVKPALTLNSQSENLALMSCEVLDPPFKRLWVHGFKKTNCRCLGLIMVPEHDIEWKNTYVFACWNFDRNE